MKKRNFITVFLILVFGSTFGQKLDTKKLDSLFQILEIKDKFMGSIAVSENGKIIYSKSIGKADIDSNKVISDKTKFRIGSISKMFTATLILKAVEEKKLNLDQTIESYFPTIENAKIITIENLLNHRSGIHDFTRNPDYISYNTIEKTQSEMTTMIANGKSDFEPNSKFEYCNSNYVLLSYILEKIYKKPYKDIVNSKIIKSLGLKNTYFGSKINIENSESYSYYFDDKWVKETETDMSIPMGAGAIVSNPTDLCQFIESLFANKIISAKSIEQMIKFQDNYGLGIIKIPFFDKIGYGHTGAIDGFGSSLTYFPNEKITIALNSNGREYENGNIMIAVYSFYFDKPFKIPNFDFKLKTEDLDKYLGEYLIPNTTKTITISKDEDVLLAQATGQSKFPLEVIDNDTFQFLAAGIKIEFIPSENKMNITQGGKTKTLTKNTK